MNKGKLYLIPNVIADDTQAAVIPTQVREVLPSIKYFFAENVRTARRYLSSLRIYESIEPLTFEVLDKDTTMDTLPALFAPLSNGHHIGVISESGCPGVADPGALAVEYAHLNNIEVVPLVGPSSLLLALMASGLNGQHFAFHGYLPIEARDLAAMLKNYEKESRVKNQTQIFIETPYRNNNLMKSLLLHLHDSTRLSVSIDLTGKEAASRTLTVKQWKAFKTIFPKAPAVFLFLAR